VRKASRIVRVDDEVYRRIVELQARLMLATGRPVSMSAALGFMTALQTQPLGK